MRKPFWNCRIILPLVECDPSQIQQVILNLILNGAQAMQSQGRRSTDHPHPPAPRRRQCRTLRTRYGRRHRPRKPSPRFSTRSLPPRPKAREWGWDLAVLYGIVKAHDGEVEVASQRNEGASFTVTLPLKSQQRRRRRKSRYMESEYALSVAMGACLKGWNGSKTPPPSGSPFPFGACPLCCFPKPPMTPSDANISRWRS